jgi:hypothetical protein
MEVVQVASKGSDQIRILNIASKYSIKVKDSENWAR